MKLSMPVLAMGLLLPLVACASDNPSLDEKLNSAFGNDERREVLRLACLNTAEKITGFPPRVIHHRLRHQPNADTARAKKLCHEMDDLYEASPGQTYEGKTVQQQRTGLAKQCSGLIKERLESGKLKSTEPLKDMRKICQEITGQPVAVPF